MIHVVHIIDLLRVGAAQKLLLTFANTVSGHGNVRLTVISLSPDTDGAIPDELKSLGVRVEHIPAKSLFDFRCLADLIRFLRAERYDIIQTHLTYANIIGTLAGRITGIPVVATLHPTQSNPGWFSRFQEWFVIQALRVGAQRTMAVGDITADADSRLSGRNLDIIPNAVAMMAPLPQDERMRIRTEIAADPDRPLVISVGGLTEQKGYPDLISAFTVVHQHHPSAVLIIVGEGKLKNLLAAQIAHSRLQDHVILLGPRDDIPRLLAASDLFVCSSRWERLPVALLEAMSAGLPVVSTSVGDIPKIVIAGTGKLVPAQAPMRLAGVICAMLMDSRERQTLGLAAKKRIDQQYNYLNWLGRLLSIYGRFAKC